MKVCGFGTRVVEGSGFEVVSEWSVVRCDGVQGLRLGYVRVCIGAELQ